MDKIKRKMFKDSDGDLVDTLNSVIKSYNNTKHSSIKMTSIHASMKKNKTICKEIVRNKRDPKASKFEVGDLVRTSDFRNKFSKWHNQLVLQVIHKKRNHWWYVAYSPLTQVCKAVDEILLKKSASNNLRKQVLYGLLRTSSISR